MSQIVCYMYTCIKDGVEGQLNKHAQYGNESVLMEPMSLILFSANLR